MNAESQQIAIAEACGYTREIKMVPTWKLTDYNGGGEYAKKETVGYTKKEKWILPENLPNYLNDLNAMHEAEEVMTKDQWLLYPINILQVAKDGTFVIDINMKTVAHATAAQRAEAFLRTLNLWKP